MAENGERWVVDKKIPVAAIAAGALFLIGQTWYVSTWMASTTARVESTASRVTTLEENWKAAAAQGEKIAVIQEKVSNLQFIVNRIEQHLTVAPPR